MDPNALQEHPQRIPLIISPENRGSSDSVDAKIVNAYLEQTGKDVVWVRKRPGITKYHQYTPSSINKGLGLWNWNGKVVHITGSGSTTTLYIDGLPVATGLDDSYTYTFSSTLGATKKLVLNNSVAQYVYDPDNSDSDQRWQAIRKTVSYNDNYDMLAGSKNLTLTSTSDLSRYRAGDTITSTNLPSGTTISTVTLPSTLVVSNAAIANGNFQATVTTAGLPNSVLTKGSVYLDGTTYMMTTAAAINGSNINNPVSWSAVNYLLAQVEPDAGVFLAKQMVYVVAFKNNSVEFFYDAGNSTGSPLAPVQGAKISFGCRSGDSVQIADGVAYWIGTTSRGSVVVFAMESLKANIISTPAIERLLQTSNYTQVYSWVAKIDGHTFYAVTLKDIQKTFVYDVTTQMWAEWTFQGYSYVPIVASTVSFEGYTLLQHENDGYLYSLDGDSYTDMSSGRALNDGTIFDVNIYTPNYDGGVRRKKYVKRTELIGDQQTSGYTQIRHSEDDYKTWSNYRAIDVSQKRAYISDCGVFRRRAWHILNSSTSPFRVQSLELTIQLGTL